VLFAAKRPFHVSLHKLKPAFHSCNAAVAQW
jgi:hypothetical protein